jgi:hypothetical protein
LPAAINAVRPFELMLATRKIITVDKRMMVKVVVIRFSSTV